MDKPTDKLINSSMGRWIDELLAVGTKNGWKEKRLMNSKDG